MVCIVESFVWAHRVAWHALAAGLVSAALAGHAGAQAPQPAGTATAPAAPVLPRSFDWSGPADAMAAAALGKLRGAAEVGVWHGGQARFGTAYNRVAQAPAQALFEVGSISKVFTGLLLAQAVERGDMALDDTLGGLLNGSPALAPVLPAPVAAITLRQLVTHTSCLPRLPADFRRGSDAANPYLRYDRARLWQALADARLAQSPPCAGAYSNLGFAVLGELLAQRHGKPWAELVQERITGPLGMHDTVQSLGDKAPRLAVPHEGEMPVSVWEFDAFSGAGALRSTAADMLVFSRALLAGAQGPLGPAAERLFTPLADHDGGQIGYAIMLRERDGLRTWLHGGGTGGFRSVWLLAPDRGEAVIALVANAQAAQQDVMTPLLAQRYPVPPGQPATDAAALAPYEGVYRASPAVALSLALVDGQLQLRPTGGVFEPLQVLGTDAFTQPTSGRQLRFERDKEGRPAVLRYTRFGARLTALRVEEPVLGLAPPQSDEVLAPYLGRYRLRGGTVMDVQATSGRLQVRLGSQPRYTVYPLPGQRDRFAYDAVRAELEFERYSSGEVRAVVLHQNGHFRAPRLEP